MYSKCEDTFLFLHTIFFLYTLKNAGVFQPKFGLNMDKPKIQLKVKVGLKF